MLGMLAALAFVIARLFYSICYILDMPILRFLMFGIGFLSTTTLFVLSIMGVTH